MDLIRLKIKILQLNLYPFKGVYHCDCSYRIHTFMDAMLIVKLPGYLQIQTFSLAL